MSDEVSIDPHSDALWPAILKNTVAFGAVGAAAGPWGIAAGALVGGLGTAAVGRLAVEEIGKDFVKPPKPTTSATKGPIEAQRARLTDETATAVGVELAYVAEEPEEAELLITYRVAIGKLIQQHARLAATPPTENSIGLFAARLQGLEKAVASARNVARRSEDLYLTWLSDQVSENKEVIEREYPIDQLPTMRELVGFPTSPPPNHSGREWWPVVEKLHLMLTCDLEGDPVDRDPGSAEEHYITFRQPQPALLRSWKVSPDPDNPGQILEPELLEAGRALVTVPGFEKSIDTGMSAKSKTSISVGLAESGALTSISSTASGRAAQRIAAVSALPETLAGALANGTALGAGFSPSAVEAADLQRQVDLSELRTKLGPSPADPLKTQRDEVARAELAARLAVANRLATDPTQAIVLAPTITE